MPQKGPGKWFRKGISLVKVVRLFPDDSTAGEWFAAMRWPDGPQCPHCASRNVLSGAAHPCMPYRCRGLPLTHKSGLDSCHRSGPFDS